jgi:hypothetical protein
MARAINFSIMLAILFKKKLIFFVVADKSISLIILDNIRAQKKRLVRACPRPTATQQQRFSEG